MRLGITVFGLVLAIGTFTAYAFGILPGFDSLAKESEIKTLTSGVTSQINLVAQDVKEDRAEHLQSEILRLRILNCQAKNDESRQNYYTRLSWLIRSYEKLTSQTYTLANCSDL